MTAPHARTALVLLVLLTLFGGALRLRHIGFGLPMTVEPDCRIPFQVENLREGGGWQGVDKELTWYPLVCARAAALFPVAADLPAGASLAEHLGRAARPYVDTRTACALIASALVPLTWFLALRFLSPMGALLAAGLVATNLLHVGFSQQSRPHAAAAATFLLALLALLRAREHGRLVDWLGAGAALALAIGTLNSGVALLFSALAVVALRWRAGARLVDPRALAALALVAVSLPIFYPYWFGEDPAALGTQDGVLRMGGHPVFLRQIDGRGFWILLRTLWFYDPLLLALSVVGLLLFLRRWRASVRNPDLLVALAFVLPYLLVVGLYHHVYERFLMPLLPYLACLGAWGVSRLWSAAAGRAARAAVASVALLALAGSTWGAWRLIEARGAPTTPELAARWLEEHVDPAATRIVLTPPLDLPLARRPEGLLVNGEPPSRYSKYYWARYQLALDEERRPRPQWDLAWLRAGSMEELQALEREPLAVLARMGADYAVIEVFAPGRNLPAASLLRDALLAGAERVARITPDRRDDRSEHPFGYEDMAHVKAEHFLLRTLQARRTGPVIEIYRLPGAGAGR